MNKRTQIVVLGLFGGAVGLSLLTKLWLNKQTASKPVFAELDGLLKLKNPNAQKQTFRQEKPVLKKEETTKELDNFIEEPLIKVEEIPFEDSSIEQLPNDEFPLKLGSEGARVARLQVWLLRNYGWTGKVTGILDQRTAQQMKRYLKAEEVDENTYHRLNLDAPVHQQKSIR